ncbi:hypothetical protein V1512DRAFT_265820 [Lipomyces arxii]|uniref:uncharacterized protein n=1 Tax=Lipomyces arxii TaxID=56418 RepID=UPI0034CED0B4
MATAHNRSPSPAIARHRSPSLTEFTESMEFMEYQLESKDQFWDELNDLLSGQINSSVLIESALRSYLRFVESFMNEYIKTDEDLMRCCYMFMDSSLFVKHKAHVRRRLIMTLVRGSRTIPRLTLIGLIVLLDGKTNVNTFEMMGEHSACVVMMEVLWNKHGDDSRLHRVFAELFYETCRVQRILYQDLTAVTPEFIEYLYRSIETSDDYDTDPYSYSEIKILLVINEQYMLLSSHIANSSDRIEPLDNKVMRVLCDHGTTYKTFGTNMIILLNREREPCIQLLILKMLYQIFTTPDTYEYFYTNDLRVLTDVFIRELNDLSEDSETLRHAFLRVLYPLLAHSQLRLTHYKDFELVKLLRALSGSSRSTCFLPISDTVARLVARCAHVNWIRPLFTADEDVMPLRRIDSSASSASTESLVVPVFDLPSPRKPVESIESIAEIQSV